jgi:dipeptidyl aminopeptidase/acylaminoacyl peptidase
MEGPKWSPDDRYITFPAQVHDNQSTAQLWFYDTEEKIIEPKTFENKMIVSHDWIDEDHLVYGLGDFSGNSGAIKQKQLSTGIISVITSGEESIFNEVRYTSETGMLFASSSSFSPYLFKRDHTDLFKAYENKLPKAYYKAWSTDGNWLVGQHKVGMDYLPFKAHIDSTSYQKIDSEKGTILPQKVLRHDDKVYLYYSRESGTLPKSIFRAEISQNGKSLLNEEILITSTEAFADKLLPDAEIINWDQDSTKLSAQLFLPAQSTKKVPLVLIPYANTYLNRFPDMDYFLEKGILLLTSQGYAVALPNNSGGTNRRRQDKNYGSLELKDALGFLDAVGNHLKVDTSNVALMGHSHGATMVSYFISHSDRFDAAIGINGAYDWIRQANEFPGRMYGFPFGMGGTPVDLPEKYKSYSPLENVNLISTPILLVSGEKDEQIPSIHAQVFHQALLESGRKTKIIYFEDEGHLIEKEENQSVFWEEVLEFLNTHLLAESKSLK